MSNPKSKVSVSIDRIAKYMLQRALIRSIDTNLIHGLHTGTERAAELTVADIRTVLLALAERDAEIADYRQYGAHLLFPDADIDCSGNAETCTCGLTALP